MQAHLRVSWHSCVGHGLLAAQAPDRQRCFQQDPTIAVLQQHMRACICTQADKRDLQLCERLKALRDASNGAPPSEEQIMELIGGYR